MTKTVLLSKKPQSIEKKTQKSNCNAVVNAIIGVHDVRVALKLITATNIYEVLSMHRLYSKHFPILIHLILTISLMLSTFYELEN